MKRYTIITYKRGIWVTSRVAERQKTYEIRKYEESAHTAQNERQPSAQSPRQNESFANTSRKLLKNKN